MRREPKLTGQAVDQSRERKRLRAGASSKTTNQKRKQVSRSSHRNMLLVFFVAVLIPISFEIAELRLTPIRLLLLVTILPFMAQIASGQVGRFSGVDKLVIFHGLWVIISLVIIHGIERIPFAIITAVELIGGYLLGRAVVRTADDFRIMIKILFFSLIFLFPFALIELFTGRLVIPELVSSIFTTHQRANSAYGRLGLERVYAVFEHPILYGLYCSIAVANVAYYMKNEPFKQKIGIGFTLGMTFMSLSSAPLISGVVQLMLILWGRITNGAWKPLLILSIVGYVVLDLLSNRTPVTILIETITFSSGTGWTRIAQFQYGILEAISNPIFGIGMNNWRRPDWMLDHPSIDNFWLLTAMRYGFVGCGSLVVAFIMHIWLATKVENLTEEAQRYRLGYLIALLGVCFSLGTVHMWGAASVFVMFYFGAGSWIYTSDMTKDNPSTNENEPSPQPNEKKDLRHLSKRKPVATKKRVSPVKKRLKIRK